MRPLRLLLRGILIAVILASCASSHAKPADSYTVIIHPDGHLYAGDQVSFEVRAPAGEQVSNHKVEVGFSGRVLGSAEFAPFGVGGRMEAILWWIWNTRGMRPGSYSLTFTSFPDDLHWTETLSLFPSEGVPPPEPGAHWSETVTNCCDIYYITKTDAARDIQSLGRIADDQSASVAAQLHTSLSEKIQLYFIPRVLGQGGFTSTGVYISYLGRNYIDSNIGIVLHHEFVHYYDNLLGGENHPTMFAEGLAVYLTGGHFKPEPIGLRAAALLDLGWYIPLQTLADDFYSQQHDISYLESAGLVQYLVGTYGWEKFNQFYRSIPFFSGQKNSDAIDSSLRDNLGLSFSDMESGYRSYLKSQTVSAEQRQDLQLTVLYFDTIRRYQLAFDPSAYYLTAWLPDGEAMRQRGIVADVLRHPLGLQNRYLEIQMISAWEELIKKDYTAVKRRLDWVNQLLDILAPK